MAAPLTAGTLNVAELPGQTYPGPDMTPGTPGVLLIASVRGALLNPQFSEAYTLSVPVVHPARKFREIELEAVVSVLDPPLMLALPVIVQVYVSAPATAATLYVLLVFAHAMMLPAITPGWDTRARTNLQNARVCPQAFPANTQML